MNEAIALANLSALSHPMRLRAVRALVARAPNGLTAGEIATSIDASPSKTTFHLNLLSEAGIVSSKRQARHVVYQVEFAALGALLRYLLEDCCGGHPTVRECCASASGDGPGLDC
ncbi:ArsR/SmtB family transcription factor [Marivita hallyeonensis]|uniref:Transcriptional regulator, ArsR family n=1 Tax=Marivita hallyeonensis TaxID=996342 RepID=A0A1M5NB50_9RHOB|nr:helix-turn-helix transcriptional regulator [Marivita hallyeonensis]SHG86718.1 transcriptional regulator, ArsR family [Marivita hallyeonensis]